MAKKRKKRYNPKKAPNNSFLISHTAGESSNYDSHGIWGNKEGKVSLKTRRCVEYVPAPRGNTVRGRKLDAHEWEKFLRDKWNITMGPNGKMRNLPRRWMSDTYLVFSKTGNPDKPRLLTIDWDGKKHTSITNISYKMNVGERGGPGLCRDVPDSVRQEFKEMVCLLMEYKYTDDFKLWHLIMPLLRDFVKYDGLVLPDRMTDIRPEIGNVYRYKNLTDAAVHVFGRATKAHRASISAWTLWNKPGFMFAAMCAKGLLPDDYLDALNIGQVFRSWEPDKWEKGMRKFRRLLSRVTETSRKRLMTDHAIRHRLDDTLRDIMRGITQIEEAGEDPNDILRRRMPRSWREYHDVLHDRLRQIQRDQEAVKYKAMRMASDIKAKQLDGHQFTAVDKSKETQLLKLVIPKDGSEVVQWGTDMRHCIGSYASDMARGRCILFGVYTQTLNGPDKLLATGEIKGNRLSQLYGKYNEDIDRSLATAVRMAVASLVPGLSCGGYEFSIPVFQGPMPAPVDNEGQVVPTLVGGLPFIDDEDVPY